MSPPEAAVRAICGHMGIKGEPHIADAVQNWAHNARLGLLAGLSAFPAHVLPPAVLEAMRHHLETQHWTRP